MSALWAVYKREVALMFRSITGYAISFGLLFFLGFLFASTVSAFSNSNAQAAQFGGGQVYTAEDAVMQTVNVFTFLLFLVAPLLSMRLLSEEAREGTLEVLMTLPMNDATFILGKFLAVWTFYTFMLALTFVHVLIVLAIGGVLNPGSIFAAYLGGWLYGGAALAVSMIWSAITEDQIVAAFLGSASVLVLFLADALSELIATNETTRGASEFIRELSLTAHYQNTLLNGLVRGEDIAYFILLIIASIFITTMLIGTRRWRAS